MTRLQPRLAGPARDALRLVDATTLKLSALAGWAQFRTTHAAAKLHVIYDPAARHPTYFAITPAKTNDIVVAQQMPIEAGATYVFDKGYYDFGFWAALDARGCRFVTRRKINTPLAALEDRPAKGPAILADQLSTLPRRLARSRQNPYAKPIRLVTVARPEGPPLEL